MFAHLITVLLVCVYVCVDVVKRLIFSSLKILHTVALSGVCHGVRLSCRETGWTQYE